MGPGSWVLGPAGLAGGLFWLNIRPGSLPPQSDPRHAGMGWDDACASHYFLMKKS